MKALGYTKMCYNKRRNLRMRFFDDENQLGRFLAEQDLEHQRKFAALASSQSFGISRVGVDVASEPARAAPLGSTKQRFFVAVAAFLERETHREQGAASGENRRRQLWNEHHAVSDNAAC